eukprot:gene5533-4167_t
MSIGDFDALGWFSNRMDPELKESLSSALKGPALYTNMYLKGPHGPGPAAEVRSKAGSLGHAGSAIHTAADSKGFPELPESAVAQNRICANPTLSLDLRDTDHVAEDTGQLPALREPCKDLEPGPSLQSPMPPSLLPQKEIIPKGIHQGRVSQSLGRACLQDVCGVDHQCEAESHDWYYVKLAKQFRSGRIELKLDLHARHRLMRLNDLIEVSPASLADSWILLVPSEIDEEQSKREQLGVPKPAQFSSAQQLVTRGLGHSCQGIAGRRGFKRKGNGW